MCSKSTKILNYVITGAAKATVLKPVNLFGIGLSTMVGNYIPDDIGVTLYSEKAILKSIDVDIIFSSLVLTKHYENYSINDIKSATECDLIISPDII